LLTVAELYYGAYNSSRVSENLKLIEELTSSIEILPFDDKCTNFFGKIKSQLKKSGDLINDSDLFIASIALRNNLCLVTNNEKHFKRIEGLRIENWVEKD
jgi:tRNA(fMet)-specific endonuclease VapC